MLSDVSGSHRKAGTTTMNYVLPTDRLADHLGLTTEEKDLDRRYPLAGLGILDHSTPLLSDGNGQGEGKEKKKEMPPNHSARSIYWYDLRASAIRRRSSGVSSGWLETG